MAEIIVLDTSALIALDEGEPGASEVEAVIVEAWQGLVEVHACFVTLTELEYIRAQERDAEQAEELLRFAKSQPVQWHHSDEALCSSAAKLKAAHRISFADSFVAALALRLGGILAHKDPEFDTLKGIVKMEKLPPKNPV